MSKSINELLSDPSAWQAAFTEDGRIDEDTRVTIKEAFSSPDAPILFPKVISRVLREAAEPQQLVTPLLSVVRMGKGRLMEFPAVNAIQASEVAEGQEFPEQELAFAEQVEGKVSKKGLKVAFTEEVINDSQWDIVGMHVRAAGRAMARLKEQIALKRFREAAYTVFDNTGANTTSGIGIDGNANESIAWEDVLDMAAVLMSENHVPTDLIMHPLMWSVFLKGSHYQWNANGASSAWNQNLSSKDGVVNATTPFGLNVITSPFVSFTPKTDSTPATSDIFLIDRSEVGVLLVKETMSTDDWNDPTRDIRALKMKERYDIVCMPGLSISVAKGVALEPSYRVNLTVDVT